MKAAERIPFVVLGAGAWGSALVLHLSRQKHSVIWWGHSEEQMLRIANTRRNEHYLPEAFFPENITITSDLAAAFHGIAPNAIVLLVVPSFAFESILEKIHAFLQGTYALVWATKGLSEAGDLLHTVCQRYFPTVPMAVLSGPSFAGEVAKALPTAVTIATQDALLGQRCARAFHSTHFRVYLSEDLIGVQLGGAVKNVLAIAVGMADGLGFGANARAALITRGLAELNRLAVPLGAALTTIMGLSGVGDVVLTCTDDQSRNRRYGLALGQGKNGQQAEQVIGQVVEGKRNVRQVLVLAKTVAVEMPICEQVYKVLYEGLSPKAAVKNLLSRTPKWET